MPFSRSSTNLKLLAELPDCFEFIGPVTSTDMPNIYARADILIAPSLYDGFGFTILEAMASGLCVFVLGTLALQI